ncbi:retrotransposon protein, putative, ty1-copia subclass [Tanacetum coccineum]
MDPTKKIDKTPYELWYANFLEKNRLSKEISRRAKELEEIQDEDTSPSKKISDIPIEVEGFDPPQEEVVPIRRSTRTHRAVDRLCLNVEVKEHSLGDLNEPTNYKAIILDPESYKWLDAMNAKMKGFTQTYVVDYEKTFSPVADIRPIRILIAILAFYDYVIWQMDVKTTFLNGYLNKDIYMVQPEGFIDPNHPRKVCKLQRSIYGHKQASRIWNKRFDEEIKRFRFAQKLDEPCVYQKLFLTESRRTTLDYYENHSKYLRNTKDMFLVYGGNPEAKLRVDCYCNAGFETDRDDIKSQT